MVILFCRESAKKIQAMAREEDKIVLCCGEHGAFVDIREHLKRKIHKNAYIIKIVTNLIPREVCVK